MADNKQKFTDTDICKSGRYCMACRFAANMRENWFKQYDVPDDIREKCAIGKTDEQVRREHQQYVDGLKAAKEDPSVAKQAANFGKAVAKRTAAAVSGRQIATPPDILEERKAICMENKCGKLTKRRKDKEYRCRACGCKWETKLSWATEECPLGFWFRVDQTLEENEE